MGATAFCSGTPARDSARRDARRRHRRDNLFAQHRLSRDADHVLPDLRHKFDQVLAQLESVAGWRIARVQRPVLILGSPDGIETGVRQMIREQPLETQEVTVGGVRELLKCQLAGVKIVHVPFHGVLELLLMKM